MPKQKKKTPVRETSKAKSIKKPTSPRTVLDNMKVADGRASNMANTIDEVKNLEELLGVKQSNPFRTTSQEILTERLTEMTLTDLQSFAVTLGILPSGNKLNLKTKIIKAFKSHGGAGAGYNIGWQRPLVDPTSQAAADILKISREGF